MILVMRVTTKDSHRGLLSPQFFALFINDVIEELIKLYIALDGNPYSSQINDIS